MPPFGAGPDVRGLLFLDKAKFAQSFAADLEAVTAEFMAASQVPWGVAALEGVVGKAAWKDKPSRYLVATADRMIPPDAQRAMAKRAGAVVSEVSASHSVYVSQPEVVAGVIEEAAADVMARIH